MSSPFASVSSFYSLENGNDFYSKKIKDWYGEECLQWASETERQLNIPLSSWVHIDQFQKVTGRDLLRFKISDFKKLVNEEYGPLFFKCFRKLVKERREDKAAAQIPQNQHPNFHSEASIMGLTENSSSWTVPQMCFNDLPIPQDDYGFGRASPVSPLHSQDRFGETNGAVSPSFSHDYQNAFSGPSLNSHGEYREAIGELSPAYPSSFTQTDSLSSYVGTSPIPSFSFSPNDSQFDFAGSSPISPSFAAANRNSHQRKEGMTSTYITQPSILSGGSLSYGSEAMGQNQSFNFLDSYSRDGRSPSPNNFRAHISDPEISPQSSLLPDFNSLMISNGSSPIRDNLDILELESSLNEESFADFDKYIHDQDTNVNNDFDCEITNDMSCDIGCASSLVVPIDGSIEDCMLKKITTGKRGNRVRHPQSWEFLIRLLMSPHTNPSLVKWEDKERGIFRLVQKEEIAKLWGKRSDKHKDEPLTYDNFARILRYHYKSKVLVPVSDKHLVYKVGDKVLANLKKQGLL